MAGCGGTNDTKTEENTKTEAAADNADAKEERQHGSRRYK